MISEKKPRLFRVSMSVNEPEKPGHYRSALCFNVAAVSLVEAMAKLEQYAVDHQWTKLEIHSASFIGDLIL